MSKIVILRTQLGTPSIVDDLLQRIGNKNPSLAEWIKNFDATPVIKECVKNALTRLGKINGIKNDSTVSDYYGKNYKDQIIGSLKTNNLPHGLGFKVNDRGMIEFIADEYKPEWKKEIQCLRGLFTDAFMAEATSSIFTILGYDVEIQMAKLESGDFDFFVEAREKDEIDYTGFAMNISDRNIYKVTKDGRWDRRYVYEDELDRKFRFTRNAEKAYLV